MVRVEVERRPDGTVQGFVVTGHAGAGPRGQDIVCAGVSAVVQTALLGLERRLGVAAQVSASDGYLRCRLPSLDPRLAGRAQDVLETMCLGVSAIAAGYPERVCLQDGRR